MIDGELVKFILTWCGLFLLIIASGLGVYGRPIAFLLFLPALILFIFANIDRLKNFEISATSVKAGLQEISNKVENAKEILTQIQDLAVENAKLMIYMRESSNGLIVDSSVDPALLDDLFKKRILDSLRKMGILESKIDEVEKSDRNIVLREYSYFIYRHALAQLPDDQQSDFGKKYSALKAKAVEGPINTEDMEALFIPYKIDQSKFADYLDDYKYYQKFTIHRRPQVWAKRSSWGYPNNRPGR